MNRIQISEQTIGPGYPPYIIAEAGVHHYNSVELARQYILQAKIAGADAIKFQTYKAQRLAAKWAPTYWDDPSGKTQYDIFAERSLLTQQDYQTLFSYAQELGIVVLSTPFDPDSATLLAELGVPAFKIASADITYFPLLETVVSFKKPILLSTGAATYDEVTAAVEFLQQWNAEIVLLHCVLSYPTPIKDANLQRIVELQSRFPSLIIGYSDHTQPQDSQLAGPLAVALGAKIVEKHFTLNKLLDGDDHYHAVNVTGLGQLVRNCKDTVLMTQTGMEMRDCEKPARQYARRSIVAAQSLPAGTILGREQVDFKRPGTGISPALLETILGKRLTCDLELDSLISYEDLGDTE